MKAELERIVERMGRSMPTPVLRRTLRGALDGHHLALCLHRVSERHRDTDWQKYLTIAPAELDALIELLLSSRDGRWLTISFDDGYRDAAEYVASRASRYPEVELVFFVCPEKTERRAGFRWDLVEERVRAGQPLARAVQEMEQSFDVARENSRGELRALADAADYALAGLDAVRALARYPNVTLGNHTNCHFKATRLSIDDAREEYRRSTADFVRLFGPQRQFAFPFGTPRHHFDRRHVELLRGLGDHLIWSTEARPYRPEERRPGAVLPRFPIDGTRSFRETAAWIASRAAYFRLRGSRHDFR